MTKVVLELRLRVWVEYMHVLTTLVSLYPFSHNPNVQCTVLYIYFVYEFLIVRSFASVVRHFLALHRSWYGNDR